MIPEGSTQVFTASTGSTSSFVRTAFSKLAAFAVLCQQVFKEAPRPRRPTEILDQRCSLFSIIWLKFKAK